MVDQPTTQAPSMKVYELAKELGVDSLSLLDRLAGLNIKVKNHMSDLAADEVVLARDSLNPKTPATGAKKKAATTKTKAAATSSAPAATKAAASTSTAAPVRRKKAPVAAPAAEPASAPTDTSATSAGPASTVIRRRVKSDDGAVTNTLVTKSADSTFTHTEELPPPPANDEMTAEEQEAAYAAQQYDENEVAAQEAAADSEEAPVAAEEAIVEATEEAPMTEVQAAESAPEAPEAPTTIKKSPIILPPRPQAPRKSFLKIVEATPVAKPRIIAAAPSIQPRTPGSSPITPAGQRRDGPIRGTTQAQDKDGFRVIRMTKENLDQMAEEENQRKKIGPRVEGEIKPEDVRFADYRKKEVVFLPRRKKLPIGKSVSRTQKTVAAAHKRVVEMEERIAITDFANQMAVKGVDVVRKLMGMGQMAKMTDTIDYDTAMLIAPEFGFEVKNIAFQEDSVLETAAADEGVDLEERPPVVTIMGHVDHGKTSLLDAIRSAKVALGEAGGITQHIGAYTVEQNGKLITFIDTPGHAAFTAMRARGANVTDIVILVVAADDGVMPQTREALSHAKAAGVPIIVAMNKIDKPGANPEKIKQQLSELDLLAEEWGGQTMFIPVSAKAKTGIAELLEGILLQSEVLDLKANSEARASGSVIEARLEKGRGPVATLLVKRGTLKVGDFITSGTFMGRVKAMMDHTRATQDEVKPGMAAEVLGFEGLPSAGEKFDVVESDKAAQELVENRRLKVLQEKQAASKISLADLFSKIQAGGLKELPVILKADVSGSVEAVRDSLLKLSNDQVKVKVLFSAPGGITESDVMLAQASSAIIFGFNVRPETKARQLAEAQHIEIKCYNIIYELIEEVKQSMTGMLDKKKVETFLGRAEVRQVFSVPKLGLIAGTAVIDGKMVRGAPVRLLRDSRVIFEGKMSSLKRFKDDAKEVATGFECGIGLENYSDIKVGDIIEAFEIQMITPELNPV